MTNQRCICMSQLGRSLSEVAYLVPHKGLCSPSCPLFIPMPAVVIGRLQCRPSDPWRHGANSPYAGFYRGRVAEAIVKAVQEHGGVLAAEDLEHHFTEMREPITTTYRGYNVYEVPPPTAVRRQCAAGSLIRSWSTQQLQARHQTCAMRFHAGTLQLRLSMTLVCWR